jgi:hypothetical protein
MQKLDKAAALIMAGLAVPASFGTGCEPIGDMTLNPDFEWTEATAAECMQNCEKAEALANQEALEEELDYELETAMDPKLYAASYDEGGHVLDGDIVAAFEVDGEDCDQLRDRMVIAAYDSSSTWDIYASACEDDLLYIAVPFEGDTSHGPQAVDLAALWKCEERIMIDGNGKYTIWVAPSGVLAVEEYGEW